MNKKQPWVKQYDPGVPAHLEYPQIPIHGLLQRSESLYSKRDALIQGERHLSYSELYRRSAELAAQLLGFGIQSGDRVALCIANEIEFVISFFGIVMAGGVVAAINPSYPLREMDFQVGIAKPRFFIGSQINSEKFVELNTKYRFEKLIIISPSAEFQIWENDEIKPIQSILRINNELHTLPDVMPDQPAVLQFSGGTTGFPKAAVGLHRNIVANAIQFSKWLTPLLPGEEKFLTAIPLYHVYGMVIGLNVGITMGATIVLIPDPRNIDLLLHIAEQERVTFFPGVPTLFNAINRVILTEDSKIKLKSLKVCISGSAPLSESIHKTFERLTKSKLVEGYGLSEAPTATHCNPVQNGNRNGSIGLPLPDVDCKIVSGESENEEVEVGETGELLIRGPQVMQGYYEQVLETEAALKTGWLHTGDIARMDKDGFFYIVGRKKELIKVGGLQVWPLEVEEVIGKIPGIKECAVTGIPDDFYGEIVKAWVVVEKEAKIDLEIIKGYCEDKLAPYKIPREIVIIDELPRSAIGKILKYKLGK